MNHITVAFHSGKDFISKSVITLSRGPVSHIALVSPCGNWIIESSGLAKPSGVRIRPFDDWAARHPGCFVRKIPHLDPDLVWEMACLQEGKDYDWFYFLAFLLHVPSLEHKNKLTCSELILYACIDAGFNPFPSGMEPVYLTPSSFYIISDNMT